MSMHDQIYVQIPSYRDCELPATLLDLYRKAAEPERLRVRVVWQFGEGENLPSAVRELPGLELEAVPHKESKGCNWARRRLQQAWRGEPYTLLLDSHHRFIRYWDRELMAMFRQIKRSGTAKPIITGYLPAYDPEREPQARKRRPYKIYPLSREDGLLSRLTSYPIPGHDKLLAPISADFASLHFLFAEGRFNQEIQFDPAIYFFGDEVVTSLRAFTHGYDLFHPHRVIGWHCYNRATRVPHWNDHAGWHRQQKASMSLMRRLFSGTYRGRYGPGTERRIADYEDHILVRLIENDHP